MISELIPVIGYYQTMLMSGYSDYQIQQIIKGSTHESFSQKQ
jgi:hypothetical protein